MPKFSERGIVHIVLILLLLAGLGVGLYLSQNTQIFRPKAHEQKSQESLIPNVKTAEAAAPLPGLAMVFDSNRTGHFEIYTETFSNLQVTQLTNNANYDAFWPRLSPDRTKILFYRTPVGVHDLDYTQASLWIMNADGSNQHVIIAQGAYGWAQHAHAEWSTDGTKIIMMVNKLPYIYSQIYTTDSQGLNPILKPINLSPGGNISDPSFKKNTTSQAVMRACAAYPCADTDTEIYISTSLDINSLPVRLTNNPDVNYDPYYSYGNTQIAWLKNENNAFNWNIWVMNADGTNQHRVTTDGNGFTIINSKPEWATDNAWIFFHRFQNNKWDIWQIHPDGTGLNMITAGQPGNNEYPSF